jgi:hypothetical protein
VVLRHVDVPDSSIADPALFLHLVPLMAAVAMQPHLNRSDQKAYRASLTFLFLLVAWVFLHAYVLFPYQYLFANADIYNPRFTTLYGIENLALSADSVFGGASRAGSVEINRLSFIGSVHIVRGEFSGGERGH